MANEQSVRLLVDCLPALIITATAAGATEFVSPQLLEYLGKTLEALNGSAVSDAVHPEDRPQTMAAWRHSLETGDSFVGHHAEAILGEERHLTVPCVGTHRPPV
jgi:PAS domain S-box-containing protein